MTSSPNKKSFDDLLESLNVTVSLVNTLMGDMRDQSGSLVVLKAKLEALTKNVETLSHIIRDENGRGSMVTRLVLLERTAKDLEEHFDDLKDELCEELKNIRNTIESNKSLELKEEELEKKYRQEKVMTKLKILAIVTPGLVSLAIILLKMFIGDTPTP
jgi:chromosome segregation ATPase